MSIALVYSQHDCDARGPDYTVAGYTHWMSQADDVASSRHFRISWRAASLARQSASLITPCGPPKEYQSRHAHALTRRQGENSDPLPSVVTDSAQKQKSLTEAFNPGTELRYIRPSRHCGGLKLEWLHEY
jgi:hypothetical protein